MPPFVLTVLKVLFLALLYFFVYRALHAAVVGLRGGPARGPSPSPRGSAVARKAGAKAQGDSTPQR